MGNSIAPVKTPELGQDEEPWYSSVGAMSSNTLKSDTQQPETDRLWWAERGGYPPHAGLSVGFLALKEPWDDIG